MFRLRALHHRSRYNGPADGSGSNRSRQMLPNVGQPHYFRYGRKPSYGCNAGLVRLPPEATGGQDVLLFSTPDSKGGPRVWMTVWASFDRAATWPVKRLVYEGPSAYSSFADAQDGTVYLLFECGTEKLYERIAVASFNLAWLTNGKDWREFLPTKVE